MKVLGICCAFSEAKKDFIPEVPIWFAHDSSAALLIDGKMVCAVEEERFNRIKHTTKFCAQSIQFCLDQAKITLKDIDQIAYYFLDSFVDASLGEYYIKYPEQKVKYAKELLLDLLKQHFNYDFPPEKLVFVKHHLGHAYSTYYQSGFEKALVCVVDGQGEKESFSIYEGDKGELTLLKEFSNLDSIGNFYTEVIKILGYHIFDEYKVMGLAPYGDPAVFRPLFDQLYSLGKEGEYKIHLQNVRWLLEKGFVPRRKSEPFNQMHKDFAAALQEMVEKVVFHVIGYWQKKTGLEKLCIAGGVGHNCTLNGLLAYSGLFKNIFVHPASHDSGAALGAAMYLSKQGGENISQTQQLSHVYFGPDIGSSSEIEQELKKWMSCMKYEKRKDICRDAAKLMSEGAVIAWVQGKMEFGPRALGNRSILADPRPEKNKDRINQMVKKREGYRPFAPSVLSERVQDYFEIPPCDLNLDFMVFNLRVKADKKPVLGATTHVNGTARAQTVRKEYNSKYWELINCFGEITGIHVVLNTSFNNMAEPIVCSVQDAITCFLTTGLDYLVINDFLISKTNNVIDQLSNFDVVLAPTARLRLVHEEKDQHEIYFNHKVLSTKTLSSELYRYLLSSLRGNSHSSLLSKDASKELFDLWSERYVKFCLVS